MSDPSRGGVEWLSPEWVEQAAALTELLPDAGDVSGSVSLAFLTAPRKEIGFHWAYQDGRPEAAASGVDSGADLVLQLAAEDAADVVSRRVAPSVAFMRGKLKASGDGGLLLAFLGSSAGDGFDRWIAGLADVAPVP